MIRTSSVWSKGSLALLAGLTAGVGCATEEANLGRSGSLASTPPPTSDSKTLWKIVDQEVYLAGFAVESGKLLWFSGTGYPESQVVTRALRRYCSVDDCAGTEISDDVPLGVPNLTAIAFATEVLSDGSYFYWPKPLLDPFAAAELSSCRVDEPQSFGTPSHALTHGIIAGEMLFGSPTSSTVAACRAADCDATITDITPKMPDGTDPRVVPQPRAYSNGYLYAANGGLVFRYKADGPSTAEVLYVGHTEEMSEFAANSSEIYWIESFGGEPGRLKSCPVTGCVGAPRVLLEDIILTLGGGLLVDEASVYVAERVIPNSSDPRGDKITRVPISGTEPPTVLIQGVGVQGPMVISGQHLYFGGVKLHAEQVTDVYSLWPTHYIAAVLK